MNNNQHEHLMTISFTIKNQDLAPNLQLFKVINILCNVKICSILLFEALI